MGIVDKLKQRYRGSYLRAFLDLIVFSALCFYLAHDHFVNWSETTIFVILFFPLSLGALLRSILDHNEGISSKILSDYPNIKRIIFGVLLVFSVIRPGTKVWPLFFGFGAELIPLLILIVANEVTIITDRKVKSADAS